MLFSTFRDANLVETGGEDKTCRCAGRLTTLRLMLIDYHMHTRLTDGVGEPADYAKVAIERGLQEIGCADHAPLGNRDTDWHMKLDDLATYVDWVREAQAKFPQLPIKLGLEVDFIPGREDWIRELAAMHGWDFFLGSVHYIGDWPVDLSAKSWEGRDVDATWREYFELWKQAARSGLFDSLAHPDLPKKFNFRPTTYFTDVFESALTVAANSEVAIEVSTAGLRKPCREIYPSVEFLKIAHRHSVPVTLGSDAHLPQEVGQDFDKAVALLRSCGYKQICRFTQRKRELVDL
jgi:histidinol-phosphatase (PHP family)